MVMNGEVLNPIATHPTVCPRTANVTVDEPTDHHTATAPPCDDASGDAATKPCWAKRALEDAGGVVAAAAVVGAAVDGTGVVTVGRAGVVAGADVVANATDPETESTTLISKPMY